MISTILIILFIPVCLFLILVVLMQAGKGGGLAGAFGGMGTQTFLGTRGAADFLSKLTIYMAIAFIVLALLLSITYGREGISVKKEQGVTENETAAGEKTATTEDKSAATAEKSSTSVTPPTGQASGQTQQPSSPATGESKAPAPAPSP